MQMNAFFKKLKLTYYSIHLFDMRAHFCGDRPLGGRDLKGGHNAPPPPPGRTKTSNSPAFLGVK